MRRYQLHMRSIGASATGMNAAVSALRFFFGVTLGRNDASPVFCQDHEIIGLFLNLTLSGHRVFKEARSVPLAE